MHKRMWDVVLVPGAFSVKECQDILDRMAPAAVENVAAESPHRKSSVRFVEYDPDVWVFQRLSKIANTVNPQTFRFSLNAWFDEGFQFTRYVEGGYYSWHSDIGSGPTETRKLSMVVQLDDEYEGGELDFFPARFGVPRQRGLAVLFPAYMPHCVKPVTKGVRHTLVTWVHGPAPFA